MERLVAQVYAGVVTYDEEKKKWMPTGSGYGISNIEILQNEDSNAFRIVGWHLHSREMILNCSISRHFKYNQATPTFHQWRDRNYIYGLNFPTADESERFAHSIQNILASRHHSLRLQHSHSSSTSSSPCLSSEATNNTNSRKMESPSKPLSSATSVLVFSEFSSKTAIKPQRILAQVANTNNQHANTTNDEFTKAVTDVTPTITKTASQPLIVSQIPSSEVIPTPPQDPPIVCHNIPPPPPLPQVNKPESMSDKPCKSDSALENQLQQAKLKNVPNASSSVAGKYPKPAAGGDFLAELQMALSQSLQSSGKIRPTRRLSSDGFDSSKQQSRSDVPKEQTQVPSTNQMPSRGSEPKRIGLSNTPVGFSRSLRTPSAHGCDSRTPVQGSLSTRMHPDDLQSLKNELFTEIRQEIHKAKDEVIEMIRQTMNKS